MTSLPSNAKPRFEGATATSEGSVQLTITGMDTKGQMFRQPATVLMMDGRECIFRSKSQPELDGSILAEFIYPQTDAKRWVSQGRVKSNHAEIEGGTYRVEVELEVAQPVKVSLNADAPRTAMQQPGLPIPEPSWAELKVEPAAGPRDLPAPPKPGGVLRTFPQPIHENGAPAVFETRDIFPKSETEDPGASQEAMRLAVASEVKQQMQMVKDWITTELGRVLPVIAPPTLEKMVAETVAKEIEANQRSSMPTINAELARQVGDRIAESKDLRDSLERMARKLCEEQILATQTTGVNVDQELSSRAASIVQSFEKSIAEMEVKIGSAPARVEQELSDRAAGIIQSFEKSVAAAEARIESAPGRVEQEIYSRATPIFQSIEKSAAEMDAKISGAPARVEQELSNHAAGIIRSFERSVADAEARIDSAPGRVEQELYSRAAPIFQSIEQSSAEMDAKISGAPARVEQELNSRAVRIIESMEDLAGKIATQIEGASGKAEQDINARVARIIQSFEESAAEMEARIEHAPARVEQELTSRAALIAQPFEESLAGMEARINHARMDLESMLSRAQELKDNITDGTLLHQESIEQLKQAEMAGIENLQKRVAEQMSRGTAQFENQLNNICAVRTIAFVMELEKHLAPHRQRTEEDVEKLGAVLQLVQGTARMQQDRLAETSQTAVANVEKEIRALLLRLAGGA